MCDRNKSLVIKERPLVNQGPFLFPILVAGRGQTADFGEFYYAFRFISTSDFLHRPYRLMVHTSFCKLVLRRVGKFRQIHLQLWNAEVPSYGYQYNDKGKEIWV